VGDLLVDLHGQHDHQLMLKPEFHHLIIDQNLNDPLLLSKYKQAFIDWSTNKSSLIKLKKKQNELEQKTQLYEFQWKELDEAGLYAEEEEELLQEMKKLDSAEESAEMTASAQNLLDDEQGILSLCRKLEQYIEELSEIDPSFEAYSQEVNTAKIGLAETASFLEKYSDQIIFDPQRLEHLRQRHRFLRQLEKKYGMTVLELISYKDQIQHKLKEAAGYEDEINKLEQKQRLLEDKLIDLAIKLHNARISTQKELCNGVKARLAEMGIPNAEIRMQVQYKTGQGGLKSDIGDIICDEVGADTMWFEVSMNKGEPVKPLADIASGGEISRVMLAFKDASLNEQKIPVMVFDEIDAGISGRISEKVGGVMRKLSRKAQILAITHQPQIAAQADHHFVVRKKESDDRVISTIEKLSEDEHVDEVASLMSGSEITLSSINSAKELIEAARKK
jgi:DNA repair protein RecN (Recombination protein N)